jgi:hypothetical protein
MTQRIMLGWPWQEFWVEVVPERPSDWAEQVRQIGTLEGLEVIEATCAIARQVVINHNLTDRDGEPIRIDARKLTPSLVESIAIAIRDAARIERALAAGGWQPQRAGLAN